MPGSREIKVIIPNEWWRLPSSIPEQRIEASVRAGNWTPPENHVNAIYQTAV